jgi:prepilin-type N-terminal cleavage/methylation domain-containing protein
LALALAAAAAYANSWRGTWVFDDQQSIQDNPTIRRLFSLGKVLAPPGDGATVQGRPVLNLSLAFNYAIGALNPLGYHAVNWAIHLAASLVLFGLVRRTLKSDGIAFASALLWVLHPLQTESVTYIIQRAESLGSLFYLLTLYFFVRWVERVGPAFAKATAGRPTRSLTRAFTMLEVMIAMAIFAMGAIVLIASYLNVLNSYHAASQGLQGDQELAFCRSQLMTITDLATAETGGEYDTPDLPPQHIKWTADIQPTAMTDVFTVVLTVAENPAGQEAKTVVDTFTLLRPTWSQAADRSALRQTINAAILTLQGRQAK